MTRTTKGMASSPRPLPNVSSESMPKPNPIDSSSNFHPCPVPSRQPSDETSPGVAGQTIPKRLVFMRRASLLALLVAPLVALPPITRVLVDRAAPTLANIVTTNLDRAFGWRSVRSPESAVPVIAERVLPSEADTFSETPIAERRSVQPSPQQRHRGVMVRADAVVRAVRSGGRPSSVPAPASGQRPAGLSLVGVSRFGTGLHDGDILTNVGGTAATSEGLVIGIVAGAISQGAKVITGVVWRGDQRIDVAVEIPGPEAFAKPRRRTSVHK